MQQNVINKFKQHLNKDPNHQIPPHIIEAFSELLNTLYFITSKYLPGGCTTHDRDDAEADAMFQGLKYIRTTLEKRPESAEWEKDEWKSRLYSRFHDGILESTRYLLYHYPISLPRALRFSLKKYSDAIIILCRYTHSENILTSNLYEALFVHDCSLTTMPGCHPCKIGHPSCVLLELDPNDLLELRSLLVGSRKSLSYYARNYRKSYKEWVTILETVKEFVSSPSAADKLSQTYDLDRLITLKRLIRKMNVVHPKLFEVYCYAMSEVNLNYLNETQQMYSPRRKTSKEIQVKFGLDAPELKRLLREGDAILNHFRKNEGLPRVQRKIRQQFTS